MTQRDYELIADAIRAQRDEAIDAFEIGTVEAVAERLCVVFLRDNPRFNRSVFLLRALRYLLHPPSVEYLREGANKR
jgi:hypothetical protein